jgi:glycosyltransferase involved in cell wall biosynthesis
VTGPDPQSVAVVIPSIGRPDLTRAVASALAQTHPPAEIIVVFDLPAVPDAAPQGGRVRCIASGGGLGGNGSRALGVQAARSTLVAFLDDDDAWAPRKLERQLQAYADGQARGVELIVATAAQVVDADGREVDVLPHTIFEEGTSVADYVLRRSAVQYGESMLCSSMLLCSRALLEAVPLDVSLRLHEDWDWLVRATREPGVALHMVPEPLLVYRRNATGTSVSSSGLWRPSAAWMDANRVHFSDRAWADGLLTVTVPMAVRAGERRSACALVARAIRHGRPGAPALTFAALTVAVPPTALARAAQAAGRLRRG